MPSDPTQPPQPTFPKVPTVTSERLIHAGSKYNYVELSINNPKTNSTFVKPVVRHPGAVLIVPILSDGKLVLIRNFRITVDQWLYEFPAGTLDPNESPDLCAQRELLEETGYSAAKTQVISWFYTTPGLTDEKMFLAIAHDLTFVGQDLEDDENIQVVTADPHTVGEWIDRQIIVDSKSICAYTIALRRMLFSL